MKKYIFSLLLSAIAIQGMSQQSGSAATQSLLKRYVHMAEKSFKAKNYSMALEYHLKLDSLIPGTPEVQYNIGVCYINSNYKKKSLPYFKFAKEKKLANPELDFMLAEAYHYNHQFDKAKQIFESILQPLQKDTATNSAFIKDLKRQIEVCNNAKELVADSVPVLIENMGNKINTKDDEYVPIISADQQTLYFTSRRKTEHNQRLSYDGRYYEDIYLSEKDSLGNWKKAKDAPAPVNGPEHDACIGISADAQTLYLFRVKSTDQFKGSIFKSQLKGKIWNKPVKLGEEINARKGSEASISVSEDNKRMYFSSDREGGLGGLDIWYCNMMPNKTWSEPKNAGPIINTEYDEDCPYIHFDDKTLFFSSSGHKSMGGFDVFSTVLDSLDRVTWTKPINLGYPINSADDDMYFIYSADGSKGYMSSAQRSDCLGERDLYVVSRPNHSKKMIILNGDIRDEENNAPIDATITVTDLEKNQLVGVYSSNSATGKYVLALDFGKNYSIQFEADNFIFHSENVNVSNPEVIFKEKKSFKLKHIKAGNSLVLNNLFFDVNQHTLKNESLPELDKLQDFLQKHPHIYIQITGHTDSSGQEAYNLKLSKKRANSVAEYLVQRGIPNKNIRIMGYGESKPVASNGDEEGKRLNRRTECLIYDMDAMPKEHLDYLAKLDTTNDDDIVMDEIAPNKAIGQTIHQQVHFLYNNGEYLTEFSKTQIAKISQALKRVPKLKLEIVGSTDLVGDEYNNKHLYEIRVNAVLNHLIEEGIAKERLTIRQFKASDTPKNPDLNGGDSDKRKVMFVLTAF